MKVTSIKLPEDLVARIEAEAGQLGRSRYIRNVVEAALPDIEPKPSSAAPTVVEPQPQPHSL